MKLLTPTVQELLYATSRVFVNTRLLYVFLLSKHIYSDYLSNSHKGAFRVHREIKIVIRFLSHQTLAAVQWCKGNNIDAFALFKKRQASLRSSIAMGRLLLLTIISCVLVLIQCTGSSAISPNLSKST